MTDEDVQQRLDAAIAELAAFETADQIAAFLLEQRCQGERNSPCNCPVATFLTKRMPENGIGITVSPLVAYVYSDSPTSSQQIAAAPFPPPVEQFINAFDGRLTEPASYPELVLDSEAAA